MTLWTAVLVASIACAFLKGVGYLLPPTWFEGRVAVRATDLVTVGMLAALVAVQTVASGSSLVVDARVPALALTAVLLAVRAPFLVVVVVAAAGAAGLRALGWAA